jgi:rod shape-determining protein MreC
MSKKSLNQIDTFSYVFSLFRFSLSRLKSFLVIASCVLILVVFNSENKASHSIKSSSIEVATIVYAKLSSPFTLINDTYVGIKNVFATLRSNSRLIEENQKLKTNLIDMQVLVGENSKLKELLKFQDESTKNEVAVRILANSFDVFNKTFSIDIGSEQGLVSGNIIMNEQGLVGKVIDMTDNTAKVLALTDLNSKIPAIFANSRKKCVVTGQEFSNNSLKVLYAPKDLEITEGEPVVTSGDGNLMPYGILIGFAFSNGSEVEVRTVVNWNELEFGKVILSSSSSNLN